MGNPERKRPLGSLRGRLEDNIKIHFKEIGWMGMNVVDLAEDWDKWLALVSMKMKLQVSLDVGKFFTSFLSRTLFCGVN